MSELLEHCFDTEHLLSEAQRVLKRGGELIITTPNICSLGQRLQVLFGKQPAFYSTSSIEHIRLFTVQSLKQLMKKHEFKIIQAKTICGFGVLNFGDIIFIRAEKS